MVGVEDADDVDPASQQLGRHLEVLHLRGRPGRPHDQQPRLALGELPQLALDQQAGRGVVDQHHQVSVVGVVDVQVCPQGLHDRRLLVGEVRRHDRRHPWQVQRFDRSLQRRIGEPEGPCGLDGDEERRDQQGGEQHPEPQLQCCFSGRPRHQDVAAEAEDRWRHRPEADLDRGLAAATEARVPPAHRARACSAGPCAGADVRGGARTVPPWVLHPRTSRLRARGTRWGVS